MKTSLTKEKGGLRCRHLSLGQLAEAMRNGGRTARRIRGLRRAVAKYGRNVNYPSAEKLHSFYPAVELMRASDGTLRRIRYNGIVAVEIRTGNLDRGILLKGKVATIPEVLLCCISADGQGLIVLVRVSRRDGSLPRKDEEIRSFHRLAHAFVADRLADTLSVKVFPLRDDELQHFLLTHDESTYFNPDAKVLVAECLPQRSPTVYKPKPYPTIPATFENHLQEATYRLQKYIDTTYAFRFNRLSGSLEYRCRLTTDAKWKPVTKYLTNDILTDAFMMGMRVRGTQVEQQINTLNLPVFDPVTDYLRRVRGCWDGHTDHIRQLSQAVPTDNPHWPHLFRRWFLAMVAGWLPTNGGSPNAVAPLLVGAQGTGKSTFCRRILPPELSEGYCDWLDFGRKQEVVKALPHYLLVNFDEFNQISRFCQEGFLKTLMQMGRVTGRQAYTQTYVGQRRMASFIATSNLPEVLSDISGSRRFICLNIIREVDRSMLNATDYAALYDQALEAIASGERTWFGKEEEAIYTQTNDNFRARSELEERFYECFRIPEATGEGQWFSASDILSTIRVRTKTPLRNETTLKLGRFLHFAPGIRFARHKGRSCYYLATR